MRIPSAIGIFLRGLLMGAADLLPGVSGGTIAFVTGIYERMVFSISSIDFAFVRHALKRDWENALKNIKSIDFALFIPLLLGISFSFLMLSRLLSAVLAFHPGIAYAFFFGLIAGSARMVFKAVSSHCKQTIALFLMGFIAAFFFVSVNPLQADHSMPVIFFAAMLASTAMLLPGVSGAFMLLVLGQYHFMLNALTELNLRIILVAVAGGFIGFITFSRALAYLLKTRERQTLSFLAGLLLGSLRLPFSKIPFTAEPITIIGIGLAIITGLLIVLFLGRYSNSGKARAL